MLRIYCTENTARTKYVFDLLFSELLGVQYQTTPDRSSAHINYSHEKGAGINIRPYGLLSETGLNQGLLRQVEFEVWESSHACFRTSEDGPVPFDIFSATFFLVARYEEHLEFFEDDHQRFTARESQQFMAGLIEEPLVNQWTLILKKQLEASDADLVFHPRSFEFLSTLDIDQAWKYQHKGFKRNIAGFVRDALHGKWENFFERFPVLWGLKRDPFYNFAKQNEWHSKFNTSVCYFFLLANYGPYDKNTSWEDPAFQALIKAIDQNENYRTGIHPSYASSIAVSDEQALSLKLTKEEIHRLDVILERPTKISRQHFLLHKYPETYDQLLTLGIEEEYSMGYSTTAGFRAGIAAPFYYYDFSNERSTSLKLIPFCLMDITPLHYMELSVDEAIEHMAELMDKVKAVGGLFCSLWHNESLGETERWKGWSRLYEALLQKADQR